MREVKPDAVPDLARRVVENHSDALDWVRSLDVHVGGRSRSWDTAAAAPRTWPTNYLLACERLVRERGEPLVRSRTRRLLLEDGAVVGTEIETGARDR
jgi:hypothetical protein